MSKVVTFFRLGGQEEQVDLSDAGGRSSVVRRITMLSREADGSPMPGKTGSRTSTWRLPPRKSHRFARAVPRGGR